MLELILTTGERDAFALSVNWALGYLTVLFSSL